MAKFHSEIKERSGLVLGGLGTGSVELYPDGELHEWQIYNTARWATCCYEEKVDDGESFAGALSFYLRCDDGERVVLRKLSQSAESEEFTYRMFPFVKPIGMIDADLRFPTGTLTYRDKALPLAVSGEFTAPFVPHDSDLSALPVFEVRFMLENPTDRPMTVSLMAKLKSEFSNPSGEAYAVSATGGDALLTLMPKENVAKNDGSLALSLSGKGKASYLGGDYTLFLDEYVSHSRHGITQESFLFDFYESGTLPNTVGGEALPEDFFDTAALDDKIRRLEHYAFAKSLLKRLLAVYPDYLATDEGKQDFLAVCQRQMRDFMTRKKPFGGSALCETLTLLPKEASEVRFVFAWHFPNHKSDAKYYGHYYETLCRDAASVIDRATAGRAFEKARAFSSLLYDDANDFVLSDAWSVHLSTLVKDSWYLKNGDFGLWEGLGFCGFNTTDILYHASHALAVLFPDIEKSVMRHTARYQRADGRIPHFFTPDLDSVDDGFHRVDMNPQFVLMVGRDYLLTRDSDQLLALWQNVVDALSSTERLDADGDGLPDTDTAYNTYDAWHFEGTPSYIAILWLSALKMATVLAEAVGDEAHRLHWQELLEMGLLALEEKLYNGRCYDLWVTPDGRRDCAVMTNQLDGEIFLRLTLGEGNLSDERFQSVIRYLVSENYKKGLGLVNATLPNGAKPTVYTFQNCQAEAEWTGVGYLMAAALLSIGEVRLSKDMIETMHQNQRAVGCFFSHWECGFRYTRPLSSFLTLMALARYDAVKREIVLCRHRMGRFLLITATATATVTLDVQDGRIVAIVEVMSGELTVERFVTMAGKDDIIFPFTVCEGEKQIFYFA